MFLVIVALLSPVRAVCGEDVAASCKIHPLLFGLEVRAAFLALGAGTLSLLGHRKGGRFGCKRHGLRVLFFRFFKRLRVGLCGSRRDGV